MTRKSLGFIPLIWECAFCSTQNPGPIKSCTGCGAPQPDDVEFLQVDQERFDFIKDEALIRMAKAGPNIHCPFCGTRNLATDELCKKCGGEISMGGKARQAGGRVRTQAEAQQRTPPPVEEPKKKKSPLIPIAILLVIIACMVGFFLIFFRTDDVSASVTGVQWERTIAVEAYTSITDSDWRDEIPEGASVRTCSMKYRYTSEEPQPNATEVCGEPYVEDTGTGVGEVVQDCEYEVYDDYCEYTTMDWVVVESITSSGEDYSPDWPVLNLTSDQREGDRQEQYRISFSGNGETYTYTTSSEQLFQSANIGSKWNLSINQLGGVQSIEPSN